VKELVVVSGKGGTGKTSLTASFCALASNAVFADADVDASDLPLVLQPVHRRREDFRSGHEAVVRADDCLGCGRCASLCRFDAFREGFRTTDGAPVFLVDPTACEGCGLCVSNCPAHAIDFPERSCGEWYVSDTRFGPMVHARLHPGADNSGKLVHLVREQARLLAKEQARDLILVDGPPGVGCPAIAAITGAAGILVVAEPSVSGAHDLDRVLELAAHFKIPAAVCVNKWDVHPDMADAIEASARAAGAVPVGRVRYDKGATAAQRAAQSIVEMPPSPLADDVRAVWRAWLDALPPSPGDAP
jgi:MinD superfamily P-loop ATPase